MSRHLIVRDQYAANCFLNNIYSTPERKREKCRRKCRRWRDVICLSVVFRGVVSRRFRERESSGCNPNRDCNGPTRRNSRYNEKIILGVWEYFENSLRISCKNERLSNISRLRPSRSRVFGRKLNWNFLTRETSFRLAQFVTWMDIFGSFSSVRGNLR